jgi:hypothetical protein
LKCQEQKKQINKSERNNEQKSSQQPEMSLQGKATLPQWLMWPLKLESAKD